MLYLTLLTLMSMCGLASWRAIYVVGFPERYRRPIVPVVLVDEPVYSSTDWRGLVL